MATVLVVRLIDIISMVSVRKLRSVGSRSASEPINRMFMMSYSPGLSRAARSGIAVG